MTLCFRKKIKNHKIFFQENIYFLFQYYIMSSIPYSAVYGWDLLEVPSNPSVSSSTNIGGNNIKFVIEQGEDIVYNGKNCYLTAQLQIVQVREDGTTMTPLEPIINTGTRAHQFLILRKTQWVQS